MSWVFVSEKNVCIISVYLQKTFIFTWVVLDSATQSTIYELSNGISNQVRRIFCLEHAPSTPRS